MNYPTTYLINLKRRPERLAKVLPHLIQHGLSPIVWEGVDGHKVPIPRGWPNPGAYGNNRSHVAVLADALEKGLTEVLVFEDDVFLVKDFGQKYQAFRNAVPHDWEALFLGGEVRSQVLNLGNGVCRAQAPWGVQRTHAYILRGDYIREMHNLWDTTPGLVDVVWGPKQAAKKVYLPSVWLAGQSGGQSDINGRTNPDKIWQFGRGAVAPCKTCNKIKAEAKRQVHPKQLTPEQVQQRERWLKNAEARNADRLRQFNEKYAARLERRERSRKLKENPPQ